MGIAPPRRSVVIAGIVLAMGVGIASCSEEERVERKRLVGAKEVCGGLFAGPLANKVESVTGDTVFYATGDNSQRLEKIVQTLKEDHASGSSWGRGGGDLCELKGKGGGLDNEASITFFMYAPQDAEYPPESPDTVPYTMGKKSEARNKSASLYLECASTRLKGSNLDPLRLYGGFTRGKSDAPGTRETREANLEILHTAALVVVKELKCKDNAGLPDMPDFTVKKAQ